VCSRSKCQGCNQIKQKRKFQIYVLLLLCDSSNRLCVPRIIQDYPRNIVVLQFDYPKLMMRKRIIKLQIRLYRQKVFGIIVHLFEWYVLCCSCLFVFSFTFFFLHTHTHTHTQSGSYDCEHGPTESKTTTSNLVFTRSG